MYRKAEKSLMDWCVSKKLKPLLLMGARQVGKTWLMKNLGKNQFQNTIYINFEREPSYGNLFDSDLNVGRILDTISLMYGEPITEGRTLIIFDEIQAAPNALTSLKYFAEDRPSLHVLAAGSLLGVSMDRGSFPVGKVEIMTIRPLNFEEFLMATGRNALCQLLEKHDFRTMAVFREKFIHALRSYFLVGGMPEAVVTHVEESSDFNAVRQVQAAILNAYIHDFGKHAPAILIPRIIGIWDGLVSQLAKENKKFVYGLVKSGARAREYEQAIDWLVNYGLVHRICNVSKLAFPLKAYEDSRNFKLYALDIGLLSRMANMSPGVIIDNDSFFQEFKGALAEQFVLQDLISEGMENIGFWSNESGTAELDFLFEKEGVFYPLEVKASENLKSKSLRIFREKNPGVHCYRSSLSNYREEDWMTNLPLFAIREIARVRRDSASSV
jgi:predicted AAA+ superfamily ATPase